MSKKQELCKNISRRFLRLILLLFALTLLTFTLVHFSPIDPASAYFGAEVRATPEQMAKLKAQWGMDKSMPEQFFLWLKSLLQGDFGMSRLYRAPVLDLVTEAFMNSLLLMMVSWLLSGLIGFVLGTISAFKHGKMSDKIIRTYSYVLVSTPANVMGLLFLIVFGVWLKLFPVGLSAPIGMLSVDVTFVERLKHFILPCLTLSFIGVAYAAMYTRSRMIEVLNSDYVLFAKARGDDAKAIFKKHAFKNSITPVLMVQFASFSELFGGSALAEHVFAYRGLGSLMTEAGLKGDLPLLLGTVLISSLFVFCGNMIADILAMKVDPRVKEMCYE